MITCKDCSSILTKDEIGLYKKLINMAPKEYLCKRCLAKLLSCPESVLDEKIKHYKQTGCFLFE